MTGSTSRQFGTLINHFRVDACTNYLPVGKPRYVMGVGYPEDLVVSIALGADMFDCVWPSRTAVRDIVSPATEAISSPLKLIFSPTQRFGNAITSTGTVNLRHASTATDFSPIEEDCGCICCLKPEDGGLGITRAYIYHVAGKETVGAHL